MTFNFDKDFSYDGLKGTLKITIPVDVVQSHVNTKVSEVARKANIPGFRPGKVPVSFVKSRYLPGILQEESAQLAEKAYTEAMTESGVDIAGEPSFDLSEVEMDKPISLTVTFEKVPDFEVLDVKKLKVKKPVLETGDDLKKELVEKHLEDNPVWTSVKRASKDGDQLTIDFEGKEDGVPFEGGQAKEHTFVVGKGTMLEEFEANLIGKKAGDSFTFEMTFPEDYAAKEMAGKKVSFDITMHAVKSPKKSKLDDKYIKRVGSSAADVAAFEDELLTKYVEEHDEVQRNAFRIRIYDQLDKKTDKFELPEAMVAAEAKRLGTDMESAKKAEKDKVTKNVRTSLILQALIKSNSLQCTEEDIVAYIKSLAPAYISPNQFLEWYVKDQGRIEQAKFMALENIVFDFLSKNVSSTDEKMSLKDIEAISEK